MPALLLTSTNIHLRLFILFSLTDVYQNPGKNKNVRLKKTRNNSEINQKSLFPFKQIQQQIKELILLWNHDKMPQSPAEKGRQAEQEGTRPPFLPFYITISGISFSNFEHSIFSSCMNLCLQKCLK